MEAAKPTYPQSHTHARAKTTSLALEVIVRLGREPSAITKRLVAQKQMNAPTQAEMTQDSETRLDLIDAGLLRPSREQELPPVQLPLGTVVFRMGPGEREQAERQARKWLSAERLRWS